jgi:hypothetical protein
MLVNLAERWAGIVLQLPRHGVESIGVFNHSGFIVLPLLHLFFQKFQGFFGQVSTQVIKGCAIDQ